MYTIRSFIRNHNHELLNVSTQKVLKGHLALRVIIIQISMIQCLVGFTLISFKIAFIKNTDPLSIAGYTDQFSKLVTGFGRYRWHKICLRIIQLSTRVSVTDIKEKLSGNQETKTSSYYFKNVTHMTAIWISKIDIVRIFDFLLLSTDFAEIRMCSLLFTVRILFFIENIANEAINQKCQL